MFLALLVMLYPFVSVQYNQRHQSKIYTEYLEQVGQVQSEQVRAEWTRARIYNQAIAPGASAYSKEALQAAAQQYRDLLDLAGDGVMGYIRIPKIGVKLPILHGTEAETLERGIGHLLGSSLPVGGENTHAVLTGHSGMATQKLFSDLPQMEIGDVFYLEVLGEVLAYRIDQIETVLPYDTKHLEIVSGRDLCTLVTCTPFGVNTHRLLVRGSRIPYTPPQETEGTTAPEPLVPSTWERAYWESAACGLLLSAAVAGLAYALARRRHIARHGQKGRRPGNWRLVSRRGRYLPKTKPK